METSVTTPLNQAKSVRESRRGRLAVSSRAPRGPRRPWVGLLMPVFILGWALAAKAQRSPIQEARELYLTAELEAARQALLAAERAGLPDRDAYLSALALRALVLHGLGEDEERDRDLERLALLAPDRGLPAEAPPSLRERFATFLEETEPMSLEVRTERTSDGVVLESVVSPEDSDVVDRVILFARLSPEQSFRRGVDRVTVETTLAGVLEYHAEAIGPGGTPLLTQGSDAQPLRFPFLAADRPDGDDNDGGSPLPWILGGSAALVATAIAIGLAVALSGSDETFQVGGPTLEGG